MAFGSRNIMNGIYETLKLKSQKNKLGLVKPYV